VFRILTLSLALAAQSSPEETVHQPYVELIGRSDIAGYPDDVLKSLRSRIEKERDDKIADSKRLETQWKKELNVARQELETLNRISFTDTVAASGRRSQLHIEIAALERGIQEKTSEQEHKIPAAYEAQLAKLWLLQHWPERRAEILHRVDEGRARERRHGDVEDIGYRKLVRNPEKDIETGEQAARQMVVGGWLPLELRDADVQLYVRRLAAKIAFNSDLKVPLHVTVLDSAQPRAIALPGGFLYVTAGVLRTARTEAELAGVLSREIARIAAQHATRGSKRSFASKLFMPVAQIATGVFSGGMNPGAYYGIGYGMQGLGGVMDRVLNGSNEGYQKEADQLGVQYAWKAGYDPRGFVSFLDSLSDDAKTELIGKEPPLPERLLNLFSEITYLRPLERPIVNSPEFDQARQRVIEMSRA
jgi:hypothetical protein